MDFAGLTSSDATVFGDLYDGAAFSMTFALGAVMPSGNSSVRAKRAYSTSMCLMNGAASALFARSGSSSSYAWWKVTRLFYQRSFKCFRTNRHSLVVAFPVFEALTPHNSFPTLWTPFRQPRNRREPIAPTPIRRRDDRSSDTTRFAGVCKSRDALHRLPDRTDSFSAVAGTLSMRIRPPVAMSLPAARMKNECRREINRMRTNMTCGGRPTVTTSRACWYKLSAASGKVDSTIFAALSSAAAPASGDPCCWYRRHARCANASISVRLFRSRNTKMACSKQRAAWNSERFCIWHSAAFIRQLLHWSSCFATRKHVAANASEAEKVLLREEAKAISFVSHFTSLLIFVACNLIVRPPFEQSSLKAAADRKWQCRKKLNLRSEITK